jgi:hypothetical protein
MDIVERLRRVDTYESGTLAVAAADEIERLREALKQIEYLDRPQNRGLPHRISIHEIALAALKEGE